MANEGMWFLMHIERLNHRDMQKMGLQLTPEEIYSINNQSLKDAIADVLSFDYLGALIASVAGLISNYGYTAYGASKFGVVGLATTLRYEYEHQGIKVSCVCPPEVKTPMVAEEHANGDPVSLELKKFAGSMEPEDACNQIFAGIESGKWMIIPSFEAKSLIFISRVLPWVFTLLMGRLIKFAVNKVARAKG